MGHDKARQQFVAWLIEVAERAPVLMAWEDLHWAVRRHWECSGC
jgi:hypothetical protein